MDQRRCKMHVGGRAIKARNRKKCDELLMKYTTRTTQKTSRTFCVLFHFFFLCRILSRQCFVYFCTYIVWSGRGHRENFGKSKWFHGVFTDTQTLQVDADQLENCYCYIACVGTCLNQHRQHLHSINTPFMYSCVCVQCARCAQTGLGDNLEREIISSQLLKSTM